MEYLKERTEEERLELRKKVIKFCLKNKLMYEEWPKDYEIMVMIPKFYE